MARPPRLALAAASCALALAAGRGHAASGIDFDLWMRAIDLRSVAVQKALERRDADAAMADARELERLYALTLGWFERDGQAADAVAVAREGRARAAAIPPAVDARDFAAAADAARAIARACNDCHDGYKPFK